MTDMEFWSEEDVKIRLIVPLLERNGIDVTQMEFETSFRITIGRTSLTIGGNAGEKRAYSDIPCRRGARGNGG